MTVISTTSRTGRRAAAAPAETTADEFEGLWINPGIFVGTEEDKKFVRLNRGIAVSDLKTRRIYDSMDPDFAAEQQLLNDRVDAIRARAMKLKEGEYVVLNMPIVLYRRQEEAELPPTPKAAIADINKELFDE